MTAEGGIAHGLDHVGIAGADLGALATAWERLGFVLTPRARHSGRRAPDAPVEPFGSSNRCVMLRQGYVELIGIVAPDAWPNRVDQFLARYPGLHIVAFAIADEQAALDRLRRAGLLVPGVAWLQRPVDDTDPTGPEARFARLQHPDAPEGEIQLIRHLTPDAIWQERFLSHPNRAEALEEVILAVPDPAASAARFSRLAGRPVVPDPTGGFALEMPRSRARLLPPEALPAVLPGVVVPALPFVAGVVIRTSDQGTALRGIVEASTLRPVPEGWLVPPDAAGGASVVFR